MGPGGLDEQCALLQELFPRLSLHTLRQALKSGGSVEQAAEQLLAGQAPTASPAPSRPSVAGRQRFRQQQRSASWGTLAEAGQAQPQLPIAPRFQAAGQQSQEPVLAAADFPTAGGAAAAGPVEPVQPASQWRPRSAGAPPRSVARHPAVHQGSRLAASSAAAELCSPAVDAAVAQLAEMFGWAGPELAAAVLEAVGQDVAAAASVLADMVAPEAVSTAAGSALGVPSEAAAAAAVQRAESGPAEQLQQSSSRGGSSGDEESGDEAADPYWRHRRHALLLSRRWQRAARGAGAAYAADCHGEARHLAAQAQRLRREALAAHAEAAERIETENNQHNSLFELDLHGLHSQEATAALDRRLQLLHSLLADPATALSMSSGGASLGGSAAPRSGRPTLRVVVGRGLHSSGGEASIPRVVEGHLAAAGLKYHARGGAIDVQLRAHAGAAAAAASER